MGHRPESSHAQPYMLPDGSVGRFIAGHPNFVVTGDGRVFRVKLARGGRIADDQLKPLTSFSLHGIATHRQYVRIDKQNLALSRVVAMMWMPKPAKFDGKDVDVVNIDGDRRNNAASNLRYKLKDSMPFASK